MAVSMDDDVPLILTLDDSGSSASAPLDELDREELPNESKSPLSLPAPCLSRWDAALPGAVRVPGLPDKSRSGSCCLCCLLLTAPCDTAGPDRSYQCCFQHTILWFPRSNT